MIKAWVNCQILVRLMMSVCIRHEAWICNHQNWKRWINWGGGVEHYQRLQFSVASISHVCPGWFLLSDGTEILMAETFEVRTTNGLRDEAPSWVLLQPNGTPGPSKTWASTTFPWFCRISRKVFFCLHFPFLFPLSFLSGWWEHLVSLFNCAIWKYPSSGFVELFCCQLVLLAIEVEQDCTLLCFVRQALPYFNFNLDKIWSCHAPSRKRQNGHSHNFKITRAINLGHCGGLKWQVLSSNDNSAGGNQGAKNGSKLCLERDALLGTKLYAALWVLLHSVGYAWISANFGVK